MNGIYDIYNILMICQRHHRRSKINRIPAHAPAKPTFFNLRVRKTTGKRGLTMKNITRKLTILVLITAVMAFALPAYAQAANHLLAKAKDGGYTLKKTSGKKISGKYYTDYTVTLQEGQSAKIQLVWGTSKKAKNVTKKVSCKTKGASIAKFTKNKSNAFIQAQRKGKTTVYTSVYKKNVVRITVNVTCAHVWKNHTTTQKVVNGTERVKVVDKTVYNPVKTFKKYTIKCACGQTFSADSSYGDLNACRAKATDEWNQHSLSSVQAGISGHSYFSDGIDYDTQYVPEEQFHYETREIYTYKTVTDYVYCTKCGAKK